MQTLFLACFICLQLTYPSPDYNQSVSQKRDSSCYQCLNALLDPSLLAPGTEAQQDQTIGEFLASNHALQEVVQERLMQELSKRPTKTKNERTEEPQLQINQEEFAILVTEGEYAFEEIVPSKPKLEPIKLPKRLNDLRGLYETYVSPTKSEILKGPGNILKNGAKLMGGESLVSENGKFRATFQHNAMLIITDQKKDYEIIKELGNPRSWKAGPRVYLIMQHDGNLVIYSEPEDGHAKYPSWESQTMTEYPDLGNTYYLKLENTGQLVIYDESSDYIVWHSGRRKSKWDHDICCL